MLSFFIYFRSQFLLELKWKVTKLVVELFYINKYQPIHWRMSIDNFFINNNLARFYNFFINNNLARFLSYE